MNPVTPLDLASLRRVARRPRSPVHPSPLLSLYLSDRTAPPARSLRPAASWLRKLLRLDRA